MNLSPHEKYYKFCPNCKTKLARKLIDGRQRFFCGNCDFIFWNNPKPVVSVLLSDGKRILMIQRASEPLKDYWCLPGGYINYDETPEDAIIRETREELGVNLTIDGLVGVYRIDNDPRGVNIDLIYKGHLKGNISSLSDEHLQYKFFPVDKLPENIAYRHREAIKDWVRKGNKNE